MKKGAPIRAPVSSFIYLAGEVVFGIIEDR